MISIYFLLDVVGFWKEMEPSWNENPSEIDAESEKPKIRKILLPIQRELDFEIQRFSFSERKSMENRCQNKFNTELKSDSYI